MQALLAAVRTRPPATPGRSVEGAPNASCQGFMARTDAAMLAGNGAAFSRPRGPQPACYFASRQLRTVSSSIRDEQGVSPWSFFDLQGHERKLTLSTRNRYGSLMKSGSLSGLPVAMRG
jgi:hypothetical protein